MLLHLLNPIVIRASLSEPHTCVKYRTHCNLRKGTIQQDFLISSAFLQIEGAVNIIDATAV